MIMRAFVLVAAGALGVSACSPAVVEGVAPEQPSSVAQAPQRGESRVLSRQINLQEPIKVAAARGLVTVTFATRQLDGMTMGIDPASLAERTTKPFSYEAHPKYAALPYLAPEIARVVLADKTFVDFWNDEESGIVAQQYNEGGSLRGGRIVVSPPNVHVLGVPRAATADGHRVVVAFITCGDDGFDLVASPFDGAQ
jgi:hypothetical protein